MKYTFSKSALLMTTLIGTMLLVQPDKAFADKGITVQPINILQEGETKTIPAGLTLDLLEKNDTKVKVLIENEALDIDKQQILQTTKTTHIAWVIEKGAVVSVESSLFPVEKFITEDQVITIIESSEERLDDTIKFQLDDLTVGVVHKMYVKELTEEQEVKTNAFAFETYEANGTKIEVGDPLTVTSFKDQHYLVEIEGKKLTIPESVITWEKPVEKMAEIKAEKERIAKEQQHLAMTNKLISQAKSKLGLPYVWGGNGPNGYDCSGYTKVLYSMIGVELPRTAAEQAQIGTKVSLDNLKVGDMVFYETYKKGPSHVSIYMGDGKVIHAAGKQVQISDLYAPYWSERILFAKRVL